MNGYNGSDDGNGQGRRQVDKSTSESAHPESPAPAFPHGGVGGVGLVDEDDHVHQLLLSPVGPLDDVVVGQAG